MAAKDDDVLYLWKGEQYDAHKKKLNGISTTVEGLKIGLAIVSTGLTVLKADLAIVKVDEKGVTFLGKQWWTWPHARNTGEKEAAAEKEFLKRVKKVQDTANEATRSVKIVKRRQEQLASSARHSGSLYSEHNLATAKAQAERDLRSASKAREKAQRNYDKILSLKFNADRDAKAVEKAHSESKESFVDLSLKLDALNGEARELAMTIGLG
ncbi:hypothetical protein [Streptomyces zagrosensis]|uniref:Uncharacterized protein n=1 Tax=Streptomyces zagrosensis TaxID=1042984 RepID=A0A7W9QI10_9ACTN|nr:hypothetical protein [Streptomyces zagrosensis]MBB5940078.1 hypothetical protein [Streptomyces zagrosensis]